MQRCDDAGSSNQLKRGGVTENNLLAGWDNQRRAIILAVQFYLIYRLIP